MAPFHWSKIPQKNSPLPLPFTLHLKTPTLVVKGGGHIIWDWKYSFSESVILDEG